MWKVLKKMTECTKSAVMLDGELSKLLNIEQGVQQGCPLSPTLFQMSINDRLKVVEAVRKGVEPDDDMRGAQDRGVPDSLDPCARCEEAVRFMEYGNNQFSGCTSHPLCKATRKTLKNGAVVELI
ncbi:unnamed protein product [Ectocarpus sp. CCAP 1310/34]|nr:unnamed protein product [Ectocarpus sp. CCAP 1310/34]